MYLNFRHGNDSGNTFTLDNVSAKEALPLSTTYRLQDGTYGAVIKLHTNQFTQADLDYFTANPEDVVEWAYGRISIPSGIAYETNDKVYTPVNTP